MEISSEYQVIAVQNIVNVMWFENLTGFREKSPQQVRENILLEPEQSQLKSLVNGKTMTCGILETPTLKELRERVQNLNYVSGANTVGEIIANVQDLHTDINNQRSLFQVASQFNLLEMVSPRVTPEDGVDIYERDRTQGPACAIACGAGTIYRNYFANVNGEIGQSVNNQIDCLGDLGRALGNEDDRLWRMKNGYALANHRGLIEISQRLDSYNESELDELRQLLRVGIQWQTQVTIDRCEHLVSQIYCSALPVAYSPIPASTWKNFAQLILEASYEATICTAILNSVNNGNNNLYLTLLGGGAFGNDINWIIKAIKRSLNLYCHANLNIYIVSYSRSNSHVQQLISSLEKNEGQNLR